jgi:spore germination cell wall hydrolase CwlJ-like protein
MFESLLREARLQSTIWRRRWSTYWLLNGREGLWFYAMAGVPILVIVGIITFAYVGGRQVRAVDTHALQREVARANRRDSDLQCLAENIYFEARGEPLEGQYAVAEVTLNRTRAEHFPHTICAVVHQFRWDVSRHRVVADFSWTELGALSPEDGPAWKRAMTVANAVYDDTHDPIAPGALFYHSTKVRPGWAHNRTAIATIGNHIFYR